MELWSTLLVKNLWEFWSLESVTTSRPLAVMGALSRKDMGLIWGCGFTFILSAKHSNSNNWGDFAKSPRRFSAVGSAEGDRTSFLNKRRKLTGPDSMKFRRFSKSAEFQAPGYSFLVVRVLEP